MGFFPSQSEPEGVNEEPRRDKRCGSYPDIFVSTQEEKEVEERGTEVDEHGNRKNGGAYQIHLRSFSPIILYWVNIIGACRACQGLPNNSKNLARDD